MGSLTRMKRRCSKGTKMTMKKVASTSTTRAKEVGDTMKDEKLFITDIDQIKRFLLEGTDSKAEYFKDKKN